MSPSEKLVREPPIRLMPLMAAAAALAAACSAAAPERAEPAQAAQTEQAAPSDAGNGAGLNTLPSDAAEPH